ncbi:MAG: AraC family transcriptional regulator [Verrucomicrobiales bacterium]|nr:AraC family transcriptional regulator [Verrucomicrobiales bacterium]
MQTQRTTLADLSWLTEVKESVQPLSDKHPIWVRHGIVYSGPTIPHPERHPYCEFSTILEGAAIAFVGRENVERPAGDYFLAGPGVAHWYKGTRYPVRFAAIYFLPSVLIEMGPVSDGMKILQRFTARQSLARRVVRPSPSLAPMLRAGFEGMIVEFDRKSFGHEVRLRTLLLEMLVQMLRWEQELGIELKTTASTLGWKHVEQALDFLREHFDEDVYARDLAAAAAVSESRLKVLFHEVLGMPWTQYLRGYRIHRAAAMLGEPGHTILETSLAVGFQSLSHFNATFRSIMGVSPSVYAKGATKKKT